MAITTQQEVRERYAVSGQEYDAVRLQDPRGAILSNLDISLVRKMASRISRDSSVLEAGAGTGRFTIPMLHDGFRVTATDVNDSLLESLQERIKSENLTDRCTVRNESIFDLSFPDESFDFAYSFHVIPRFLCLEDQAKAIEELSRVLKPGGLLLFNFWNKSSLLGLLAKKYAARAAEIDHLLAKSRLEVIERRGKWLISRNVLSRLPLLGGRLLARTESATSRIWPRRAWDVFVLASKKA